MHPVIGKVSWTFTNRRKQKYDYAFAVTGLSVPPGSLAKVAVNASRFSLQEFL